MLSPKLFKTGGLVALLLSVAITLPAQNSKTIYTRIEQYLNTGYFAEALKLARYNADSIYVAVGESKAYFKALIWVGRAYTEAGNNTKAIEVYNKIREEAWKINPADSLHYAIATVNLSKIFISMQNFEEVEEELIYAAAILEAIEGKYSNSYAATLKTLVSLYSNSAQWGKAEMWYTVMKGYMKELYGAKSNGYADFLAELGNFYRQTGDIQMAETYWQNSLVVFSSLKKVDSAALAGVVLDITYGYIKRREIEKADIYFSAAERLAKQYLIKGSDEYATYVGNCAEYYLYKGETQKAEQHFLEAIETNKNICGEKCVYYGITLTNYAGYLDAVKKYDESIKYNTKALEICLLSLDSTHYLIGIIKTNTAAAYHSKGDYRAAGESMIEALKDEINFHKQNVYSFNEQRRKEFWNNFTSELEVLLSIQRDALKTQQADFTEACLYLKLQSDQMLVKEARADAHFFHNSTDTSIKRYYAKQQRIKEEIYLSGKNPEPALKKHTDSLVEEYNHMESLLNTQRSINGNKNELSHVADFKEIQNALPTNAAALHFIVYPYHNAKTWTDSNYYGVFIIRKDNPSPAYLTLTENKNLSGLIKTHTTGGRGMSLKSVNRDSMASIHLKQLYALLFSEAEALLSGINTLYISKAGRLNDICFDCLTDNTGKYLIDKYEIHYVHSTADIPKVTGNKVPSPGNMVLFGGVNYDAAPGTESEEVAVLSNSQTLRSALWKNGFSFSYLQGTLDEVNAITGNMQSTLWKPRLYTGVLANEKTFKSFSEKKFAGIIHIATHGFFIPQTVSDTLYEQAYDNPLLRSGLALAGANYFSKQPEEAKKTEDGVLTAFEISNLNLENVPLLVLSACETGVGETIDFGESDYGLLRSFRIAGVKNMITSLWEVPDEETSQLMQLFYRYVAAGKSFSNALRQAKFDLRKQPGINYSAWGGFVLTEE